MCNWEEICDDRDGIHGRLTSKMEVEGGWLYLVESMATTSEDANGYAITTQFVPKPKITVRIKKVKHRRR